MIPLPRKVGDFIAREGLLAPGARVVVGLSGGADSTALLVLLKELGYEPLAVHCHFGLRGAEADRDLGRSRALAESLGCEFEAVRFDTREYMATHGVSAEMACRELRYEFFETFRREHGAEAIAVGHHRDDNVETFFLNLLRGAGLRGLRGMKPRRDRIIRPLLETTREEILAFLAGRGLDYVTDSTNAENDFRRNRLRNVVLPLLEREFPGASEAVARSIGNLRGYEELLDGEDSRGARLTRLVEQYGRYGFTRAQLADALDARVGAVFAAGDHELAVCRGGELKLTRKTDNAQPPKISIRTYPRRENLNPEPGVVYLDADLLPQEEFRLRRAATGDRIRPFGMGGRSKLVSDVLAEAGVPANERADRWVLTLGDDIIWVVGVRASNLYRITENTKNITEIRHE